jgi:4-hydroxythreonine-4-phosphate dehydrogenase
MKPRIGITAGDPAGIGPEVVLKALATLPSGVEVTVYGAGAALGAAAERNNLPRVEAHARLVDVSPGVEVPLGIASAAAGQAAAQAVLVAARDALAGRIDALVTAPLNKASLRAAGYAWPGHTEMLAECAGVDDVAMMFVGGGLRVALLTIHRSLASVPGALDTEAALRIIRLVHSSLPDFCPPDSVDARPIALCGLNPHAGEGGLFGDEEQRVLSPVVETLRREGLDMVGPAAADTLFVRAARGEFAAVIACYHDQGLIPVKMAAFGSAVNVTLGLPFIRTSVDHGTAFDIAGRGGADPGSLNAALKLGVQLARRRLG